MARPLKEGISYFPHDTDAINDHRIQQLIGEYGLMGYGFYFALLGEIYSQMPNTYRWEDQGNADIFSRRCRLSVAKAQRILNFCVKIQLFDTQRYGDDSTLISHSIIERADAILKARDKKREQRNSGTNTDTNPKTNAGTNSGTNAGQTGESIIIKHNNKKHNNKTTTPTPSSSGPDVVVVVDETTKNVFTLFSEEIGQLTPLVSEELKAAEIEFGEDTLKEAIGIASKMQHKSWQYISGILENKRAESGGKFQVADVDSFAGEPDPEAAALWRKALEELETIVSGPNFRTWLEKTTGLSFNENEFILGVPNGFVAEYLDKNQRSLIERTLINVTGRQHLTVSLRLVPAKVEQEASP